MRPSLYALACIALLFCACDEDSSISGPENPGSSSNALSSSSAYSSQAALSSGSSSSTNASSSGTLAQTPLLSGQDCTYDSTWNGGNSYRRFNFHFNSDGSFDEAYHSMNVKSGIGPTDSENEGVYSVEQDSLRISFASGDVKYGYRLGEDQNYRLYMPQTVCTNTRGDIYNCSEYYIELQCKASGL